MLNGKDLMMGIFFLSALIGLIVIAVVKIWLDHKRREMAHKERMTAMEKGLALPPPEQTNAVKDNKANTHFKMGMAFLALGVALTAGLVAYRIVHTGPVDGSVSIWVFLAVAWFGLGGANLLIYRMLKPNGRPQP